MGVRLLMAVHNHQPVGNFGWVIGGAFDRSYGPFLDVLKNHPSIKLSLHITGPLLDWIAENRPGYFDAICELHGKGQIELMGGAYYEPIISVIPEEDARGQIALMRERLAHFFGAEATGMWLAERIWEPSLPRILAAEGIRYTLLDDTHFRHAGLSGDALFGYYLTEYAGDVLAVFPIDRALRYTIPFREPEETIARLKEVADKHPGAAVVYGDDGEKFGEWPGTHEWVFEAGWLDRFFSLLTDNQNWISIETFGEYIKKNPPSGRVYLPTASYEEMLEWALMSDIGRGFKEFKRWLKEAGKEEEARSFVRGGFFNNFFVKYEEANNMHKRMIEVSRKVNSLPNSERQRALPFLYKAQCNCAYWHGLFGGLYLNHLRHAVYQNLSRAEKIADSKKKNPLKMFDINVDGEDEILVNTPGLVVYLSPHRGGSMFHLELREFSFALSNTLSRTREIYHDEFSAVPAETGDGKPQSIHDQKIVKEAGLFDLLIYDRVPRFSFLDRFFDAPPNEDDLMRNRYRAVSEPCRGRYSAGRPVVTGDSVRVVLFKEESIVGEGEKVSFGLEKVYTISLMRPEISVRFLVRHREGGEFIGYFSSELNLTLLAGNDPKRYLAVGEERLHLVSRGSRENVSSFSLVNEDDGFIVACDFSRAAHLFFYGVETASQSEGGLERTYQGSAIVPVFPVMITPGGEFSVEFHLNFKKIRGGDK